MAMWPRLPNSRVVVGGVDISVRFQIALQDGYELDPPEPKTYTVDVPGGNGVIDLTEALTGDVAYKNRHMVFDFICVFPDNFEEVKTAVSNFMHGRAFDFTLSWDPGYTYHGRFTVSAYSHTSVSGGKIGDIKVEVDANPYKLKERGVYRLNATGGHTFRLLSGRRPVRPVIECSEPCTVAWAGEEEIVPAGTYRLNDVLFREGLNEIYINSRHVWFVTWDDLAGAHTWDSLAATTWDHAQLLGGDVTDAPRCWDDAGGLTWESVSEKTWLQMNFGRQELPECDVYLKYDWEDL